MSFNIKKCDIPSIWCGDSKIPKGRNAKQNIYYYKVGTRYECLKKGFGAGKYNEIRSTLPKNSLRRISYVGKVYEKNFKLSGISTLNQLESKMKRKSPKQIKILLKKVFTKKGGAFDERAYNSTLIHLYINGITNLPDCMVIKK